ncbi:MAG: hypothetical protein JXA22_04080 [Candidatus Thermoplasmatota archaeon]|nr:hypothetical protein [Candidatus Thermoplasmatota archaeon]
MPSNVIVTLSDSNYIDQARQLFSSIYFNSGWTGDYLLLAHDLTADEKKWFTDRGIYVRDVHTLRTKNFAWLPGTVLDKFYLFDEWMRRWDQVLYIDADTTVEASLAPLIGLKGIWASPDFHDRKLRGQFIEPRRSGTEREKKKALDRLYGSFDVNAVSFNSGVILYETAALPDDPFNRSIELYNDLEPIVLHDQSILNLLLYGKWSSLPLAYNNYFLYKRVPWSMRFEKYGGIINHYVLDKVWNTKNQDYYPRWKCLLERADMIDLERRPVAQKELTDHQVMKISHVLSTSTPFRDSLCVKVHRSVNSIDRSIGRIGMRLNEVSPGLYRMIRR